MKKVLLSLLLGLAGSAYGAPFLVCDAVTPQSDPNLNPVSYNLSGLAQNVVNTPATQNTDGTLQLKYDLANLSNGSYTVTAAAINIFGGTSGSSAPLSFTKGAPGTPTNLRIAPN